MIQMNIYFLTTKTYSKNIYFSHQGDFQSFSGCIIVFVCMFALFISLPKPRSPDQEKL